jgi:hypothetical protein
MSDEQKQEDDLQQPKDSLALNLTSFYMILLSFVMLGTSILFIVAAISDNIELDAPTIGGSGLLFGAVWLVIAIAAIAMVWGLFRRIPWAFMGTIAVNGVAIAAMLLWGLFGAGFDPLKILSIIISAAIIYAFLTDETVKDALAQ